MLGNFISSKILENLGFQPTPGQEQMIAELGAFVADGVPGEVMLVKGYAGTGKTTLVSSLVRTLASVRQKSILLAPTGRAAKVLSAYTGRTAWTIHKKIYRQKRGRDGLGDFVLDKNLHKGTYFIVDEASMIGERTADSPFGSGDLLQDLLDYVASGSGCRLVLVGDTAQLPPVGLEISPALDAGRLASLGYRTREIEMADVIRQAVDSGILFNATAIRRVISGGSALYPEFSFRPFEDIDVLGGDQVLEALQSSYDRYGTGETMVVTRSNKRANRFNAAIRSRILWREEQVSGGDLLMVVRNNYFWKDEEQRTDFIANGDIVRVERVGRTEEVHGHRFADVELSLPDYGDVQMNAKIMLDVIDLDAPSLDRTQQRELYQSVAEDYPGANSRVQVAEKLASDPYYNALQVKFAYAVTCHKSQGGQWRSVFLDPGYFKEEMLNIDYLRWLYTAFTRATERLSLVNMPKEFLPAE